MRGLNKIRNEKGKVTTDTMKDHKKLLQTTVCQYNEKPRRKRQLLKKLQHFKIEPGRNSKYEQTNHEH